MIFIEETRIWDQNDNQNVAFHVSFFLKKHYLQVNSLDFYEDELNKVDFYKKEASHDNLIKSNHEIEVERFVGRKPFIRIKIP